MMNIDDIYSQLTDVNIDEQKAIWNERGKGYYGEYLLFCELYKSITGSGKLLMNLNIPVDNTKTTEIDLILIHETGIYVFEIKHYKGTIYGKDTDQTWTQYFRTVKNNKFRNPVDQNRYHIEALKQLLPDVPLYSCVVFTSTECDLRVNNSNEVVDICKISDIDAVLKRKFSNVQQRYTMDEINVMFETLSSYSQMKEPVLIDGVTASFSSWVNPIINELKEQIQDAENEQKQLKKRATQGMFINIVVAAVSIIAAAAVSLSIIQKNNAELLQFKQKFLHVDSIDNEYIDSLNSYVEVTNVSLVPLTDDAVNFAARIAVKNDVYGIAIEEESQYIVMTTSGKVYEYDTFGERLKFNRYGNMIGTGIRSHADLAEIQFYGISETEEISYIKLTGIKLFRLDSHKTTIKRHLEIELYNNNNRPNP